MPQSGVKVHDDVKKIFSDIKFGHKHSFCFLRIEGEKEIVLDCQKMKCDAGHKEFFEKIQELENECRYAILDIDVTNPSTGAIMEKIVLVQWCPMTAKVKSKMLYASTLGTLKDAFKGVGPCIQATELDELTWDAIEEKVKAMK